MKELEEKFRCVVFQTIKNYYRDKSLFSRVCYISSLIIIFVIAYFVIQFSIHQLIERQVKIHYYKIQKTLSHSLSNFLNKEIIQAHQYIIKASSQLNGLEITEINSDQFIQNNSNLATIFNNGLYLFSREGILLAEESYEKDRVGLDYSYRKYIIDTIKLNKPIISNPYISSKNKSTVAIMFTSPIYNKVGQVVAIFAGSIDLERDNFIKNTLLLRLNEESNFVLLNKTGVILSHINPNLIYGHMNLNQIVNSQTESDDQYNSYLMNAINYPEWVLVSNPFNETMESELAYYYNIVDVTVFIVLVFCVFILYWILSRHYCLQGWLISKLDMDKLQARDYLAIEQKGSIFFKALINKVNQLISEYRNSFFHNRAIQNDIFNLLHHSSSGFVSFRTLDNKISSFNSLFLKMTNKDSENINEANILTTLFSDYELYYKPFTAFIEKFDDISNTHEFNIINVDGRQIRVHITAYKLHFLEQEQIALIIDNKESHEELQHQSTISKNINEIILEHTKEIIHFIDTKGKIQAYNHVFKENFTAYSKLIGSYIWELLEVNKEKVEVEQFVNSLKTYPDDSKHLIVHLRNIKTHEMDLYHLYYYIVLDKNEQKTMLIGFLKK